MDGKAAICRIPDDVVRNKALSMGGTGKIQKNKLRDVCHEHRLPTA
ncbi:hypothetical protein ACHAC9_01035 [Massilia sp. CMS3.1]